MARTYKRDSRGRFASAGGGGRSRPATRMVSRGPNRLTRDNAGRITSIGGDGATARGGRLRTASGKQRATQLARLKGGGGKLRRPTGEKSTATMVGKPLGGTFKKTKGPALRNTTKGPVTLSGLQKAGGSRWQKNGMDRVYFNNVAKKAGIDVDRYKSGNISSAAIRGRGVSNAKAGEVLRVIGESKVYYDRKTRKMMMSVRAQPGVRSAQQETAKKLITSAARKLKKESRMKPRMWRKGSKAK